VTDIGNDLAYEEPVDRIMEWVETCARRLAQRGAKVALTNVPIDVLKRVSRLRFELFRTVLFPKCRLPWTTLLSRAEELHERLAIFASDQKLPIFTVPNAWHGFDPIHPRSRYLVDYWRAMLGLLVKSESVSELRRTSLRSYWRLRTLSTPDVRWRSSRDRFSLSHALLDDESSVTLY
jgi:hypothetical protein